MTYDRATRRPCATLTCSSPAKRVTLAQDINAVNEALAINDIELATMILATVEDVPHPALFDSYGQLLALANEVERAQEVEDALAQTGQEPEPSAQRARSGQSGHCRAGHALATQAPSRYPSSNAWTGQRARFDTAITIARRTHVGTTATSTAALMA